MLDNGIIVETWVLYEIPLTLNANYPYRDIIVLKTSKKKNTITIHLLVAKYLQSYSQSKDPNTVELTFEIKSKNEFSLINEHWIHLRPEKLPKFYQKRIEKNMYTPTESK